MTCKLSSRQYSFDIHEKKFEHPRPDMGLICIFKNDVYPNALQLPIFIESSQIVFTQPSDGCLTNS